MAYPADLLGKAIQLTFTRKPIVRVPGSLLLGQHSSDIVVPVYDYKPGRLGVGAAPAVPPKFTNTNTSPTIRKLYVVQAVKTMHLQPWSAIKALRTFAD